MISRKINWVSSLDPNAKGEIRKLEAKLSSFYLSNATYYAEIDFTSDNWVNKDEVGYQEIVKTVKEGGDFCEVGCGQANLLHHFPDFANCYSGCDFSSDLMKANQQRHPHANFRSIMEPNVLPFESDGFDFVFSVFVLEHSTEPAKLLSECERILKPGGRLIILCPDFIGQGKMTSQRAGWSAGTTSQKIKRGRILDAIVTFYDNRIRIPFACEKLQKQSRSKPIFAVNLSPVVFEDPFLPDVDAIYVTNREEIVLTLQDRFVVEKNSPQLLDYERDKNLIFLSGQKKRL